MIAGHDERISSALRTPSEVGDAHANLSSDANIMGSDQFAAK